MAVFNEPTKWAQALGATANADVIPDEAGATEVDISKIFPAVFSLPLAQGGKAIPRRTLNGLFKALGDWSFYAQNGGIASYDEAIDYAVGRVVLHDGNIYRCIQSSNSENPHSPVDANYWSKITTIADIEGKADRSLSNVDSTANILMAHNAMPGNRVVALTLPAPATGTRYRAPADGFVIMQVSLKTPNTPMHLYTTNGAMGKVGFRLYASAPNQSLLACIPVNKNEYFYVYYSDSDMTDNYLNFVYAQGSVSEAN